MPCPDCRQYNPSTAALMIGTMSALWHIPLFLLPAGNALSMAAVPFWSWVPGAIAKSFLYAWLFNSSFGSLIVVILFHLSFNISGAVFGSDRI